MSDIAIDIQTGDIRVENNALYLTELGQEDVTQRLRIRLRLFHREWILDRSVGTRWFEIVLRKGVDKFAADQEVRRVVLETKGVRTIEKWESTLDESKRQYSATFDVRIESGELISFGFKDV